MSYKEEVKFSQMHFPVLMVWIWRHQNMIVQIMIKLLQISIYAIKPYNVSLYQI